MAISYTHEYEQLIIFDFKSDKSNLDTISKLLTEVKQDVLRVKEFILSKIDRIDNLADILEKLQFVENEKVALTNYFNTRELHDLLQYIKHQEVSYEDIVDKRDKIFVFYEKLSPCRCIEKELLRMIKKEGFDLLAKLLHELQFYATRPVMKYLMELYDTFNDLLELQSNLESEKQRYEYKLGNGKHKYLLEEIRQSKLDYRNDTALLLDGLSKIDRRYYCALKQQLDDQYNRIIQTKLLQLNKLVNHQENIVIDEKKFIDALKVTRKKYLRLQRYILS